MTTDLDAHLRADRALSAGHSFDEALRRPTGLEECVRGGVGMPLAVQVESGALVFRSRGYFCEIFGRRIDPPGWLHPGVITVTHCELDPRRFTFTLTIDHPWFGRVLEQQAEFSDAVAARRPRATHRAALRLRAAGRSEL